MNLSKLKLLRQVEIQNPCPEDWDSMKGDDRQRFCAGCGCFVHNLSGMAAAEAEELLATPERVCTRMTVDPNKGILTRDGWIPRLLLAGAMAASVAGCATELTGDPKMPSKPTEAVSAKPKPVMGDLAPPSKVIVGKIAVPPKPRSK